MTSDASTTTPRRYNSSRRSRQRAQTRDEILTAAVALFTERGWAGSTLAAIAERADVAVETIYSGFGSKKGLLRAAMDVAVVGDAAEVPLAEREEYARLGSGSLEQRLRAATTLLADVHERSAGVWRAIVEAAPGDAEINRSRAELESARRIEVERAVERVLGQRVEGRTLDLVWALLGPEMYLKLRGEAGMSRADYEACMADALVRITDTRAARE
jgi:AcrR family transcriptional regulator